MRRLIVILACLLPLAAGDVKLYLKDGGFHIVREYAVEGDRVRYYSVERADWEEIPLELVDLKRTLPPLDELLREVEVIRNVQQKHQAHASPSRRRHA